MEVSVFNSGGTINSLQVSVVGNITAGNFSIGKNFLIKNITDGPIEVTIIPSNGEDISTILYPGWNPEICRGVINAPDGALQYGY